MAKNNQEQPSLRTALTIYLTSATNDVDKCVGALFAHSKKPGATRHAELEIEIGKEANRLRKLIGRVERMES